MVGRLDRRGSRNRDGALAGQGGQAVEAHYAGYLIEKALSIDNIFVIALIFSIFAVPAAYQHKVLFWGVIGALVFRLAFIFVGAGLLESFFWSAYVFGAFIVYTGYKMAFRGDKEVHPDRNRSSGSSGGSSPRTPATTATDSSPASTAGG